MQQKPQKERLNWVYQLVCWIYRFLFYFIFGGRIFDGPVDIPTGGCVVMSNHINLLDAVSVAISIKGRELRYMGKAELFKVPVLGSIFRYIRAFPVQRGQVDMASMRTSMQILRNGEMLGIFPEGHRSKTGEMGPLQAGASVLALKCDVPIIPLYIAGRYRPGGRIRVAVGRPIAIADLRAVGADKESVEQFTHRMEQAFASLAVRAGDNV